MAPFRALRLHQTDTAAPDIRIEQLTADDLSIGNVLIANEFSSLNYKDALAVTGKGKIIRDFPMIPGIDAAGVVLESADPNFHKGARDSDRPWRWRDAYWGHVRAGPCPGILSRKNTAGTGYSKSDAIWYRWTNRDALCPRCSRFGIETGGRTDSSLRCWWWRRWYCDNGSINTWI